MSITPEARASKVIAKTIDSLGFDPDMFAYSFTQGTVGADVEIQIRMFEIMVALCRVWGGWHVSGYAGNSKLAGVCEDAHKALEAMGIENVWGIG